MKYNHAREYYTNFLLCTCNFCKFAYRDRKFENKIHQSQYRNIYFTHNLPYINPRKEAIRTHVLFQTGSQMVHETNYVF